MTSPLDVTSQAVEEASLTLQHLIFGFAQDGSKPASDTLDQVANLLGRINSISVNGTKLILGRESYDNFEQDLASLLGFIVDRFPQQQPNIDGVRSLQFIAGDGIDIVINSAGDPLRAEIEISSNVQDHVIVDNITIGKNNNNEIEVKDHSITEAKLSTDVAAKLNNPQFAIRNQNNSADLGAFKKLQFIQGENTTLTVAESGDTISVEYQANTAPTPGAARTNTEIKDVVLEMFSTTPADNEGIDIREPTGARTIRVDVADSGVTTEKIKDANVTHDKLAADAVETDNIKDNAVTAAKIADGVITDDHIADDSVEPDMLDADDAAQKTLFRNRIGAVSAEQLNYDLETTVQITNGAGPGTVGERNVGYDQRTAAVHKFGTISSGSLTIDGFLIAQITQSEEDHDVSIYVHGDSIAAYQDKIMVVNGVHFKLSNGRDSSGDTLYEYTNYPEFITATGTMTVQIFKPKAQPTAPDINYNLPVADATNSLRIPAQEKNVHVPGAISVTFDISGGVATPQTQPFSGVILLYGEAGHSFAQRKYYLQNVTDHTTTSPSFDTLNVNGTNYVLTGLVRGNGSRLKITEEIIGANAPVANNPLTFDAKLPTGLWYRGGPRVERIVTEQTIRDVVNVSSWAVSRDDDIAIPFANQRIRKLTQAQFNALSADAKSGWITFIVG